MHTYTHAYMHTYHCDVAEHACRPNAYASYLTIAIVNESYYYMLIATIHNNYYHISIAIIDNIYIYIYIYIYTYNISACRPNAYKCIIIMAVAIISNSNHE